MLRRCCQLTAGSMGFDRLDTSWGALDLTLSDIAAVQGAQSALGLLGLIAPLWLSVFDVCLGHLVSPLGVCLSPAHSISWAGEL